MVRTKQPGGVLTSIDRYLEQNPFGLNRILLQAFVLSHYLSENQTDVCCESTACRRVRLPCGSRSGGFCGRRAVTDRKTIAQREPRILPDTIQLRRGQGNIAATSRQPPPEATGPMAVVCRRMATIFTPEITPVFV
jgi:hypothetical protein